MGVGKSLTHLVNRIARGLPPDVSQEWAGRFKAAVLVKADPSYQSYVVNRFLDWLFADEGSPIPDHLSYHDQRVWNEIANAKRLHELFRWSFDQEPTNDERREVIDAAFATIDSTVPSNNARDAAAKAIAKAANRVADAESLVRVASQSADLIASDGADRTRVDAVQLRVDAARARLDAAHASLEATLNRDREAEAAACYPIYAACADKLIHLLLGIKEELEKLTKWIGIHLSPDAAQDWPERFEAAIPVGADLSKVVHRFLHWLLSGDNSPIADYRALPEILKVAHLYERDIADDRPTREEWEVACVAAAHRAARDNSANRHAILTAVSAARHAESNPYTAGPGSAWLAANHAANARYATTCAIYAGKLTDLIRA